MKKPATVNTDGLALSKLLYQYQEGTNKLAYPSVSNNRSKGPRASYLNSDVMSTARRLANLYRSMKNSKRGFTRIYLAFAMQLNGEQRRLLHRNFKEVLYGE